MSLKEFEAIANKEYEYGFKTDIKTELIEKGLNEDVIRLISEKNKEPEFVLEFRLKAYRHWLKMEEPEWPLVDYPKIDYQDIHYYAAPEKKEKLKSMDDVDPELKRTFEKLGIPLQEQKKLANVAVDAIFDSVSVATTYKDKLLKHGVVFCPLSEAVEKYPDLVKKYMGSVVPHTDNFFAALNAAVFTEGSFVYVPKDTVCPMELSTYFRINAEDTGQFERTLIICEENASVSYLEGCTAPMFDKNQLHAAVVELVALDNADIKYSTVQNWYAGDPKTGKGGIYNFVTKRGKCLGKKSKISWTQIETGSAITWKYPSCILMGDDSIGEFYSVALTNHHQQADTGTKMIHIGKRTKSTIISKGISAGKSKNTYRGLVQINKSAKGSENFTQCDSMLIGPNCTANTFPYIDVRNASSTLGHEAATVKVSEEQILYCQQRGISLDDALTTIVNGFCSDVFKELPTEFAVEATQLLSLKLENTVG
ncbi:Fe-S cluster assembly protein SufB [Candidatus Marinamargulisbacteria bacterium SCGC AG-343-D04]|nr:Fe-S cluster assembly protein SufB [Candidatus Marinamargulisbacteria bacterium SCGC AG-343-D04]